MRLVSDELDAEVLGTTTGDRLEVVAWRGGMQMTDVLDVSQWSMGWSGDRQVQGQATVVVADPDGTLGPWGMGDALAPGGSRLQVAWVSGLSGLRVPLGWWRIRRPDPVEEWRVYGQGASARLVPSGGAVTVRADEMTAVATMSGLDAEVVPSGATVLAEVRRLLSDICAVTTHPNVGDAPVPGSFTYGDGRMDAVTDLLGMVRAAHRMGPDGTLEVVPVAGVGPVWTIAGGEQGALVRTARSLSDDGVFNAAISSGETPDGAPLIGRAYTIAGPLAWGGPFGKIPTRHRAIATTQSGVDADARTVLETATSSGTVDLAVTCLTHPGIQMHDRVVVLAATTAGEQPIEGRVVGMSMQSISGQGSTPSKSMSLTVRVSTQALEAIAARVRRG